MRRKRIRGSTVRLYCYSWIPPCDCLTSRHLPPRHPPVVTPPRLLPHVHLLQENGEHFGGTPRLADDRKGLCGGTGGEAQPPIFRRHARRGGWPAFHPRRPDASTNLARARDSERACA